MLHLRFNQISILIILLLASAACSTPKDITYFQDLKDARIYTVPTQTIKIKPADKISIVVNSRDAQLTDMFNLPYVPRNIGTSASSRGTSQGLSAYTVSPEGSIDFPFLGEIKVEGMTRLEIAALIKGMLISKDLVRDPVVTVELTNGIVTVMGEVAKPGSYAIDRDDMTILDALGLAGDLTIYGKRQEVKLVRSYGDRQETYIVSLLDVEKLRNSPAYLVQQDDVIYIDPNKTRIRQSTLNGNTFQSTSFWISLASLATTITSLIILK